MKKPKLRCVIPRNKNPRHHVRTYATLRPEQFAALADLAAKSGNDIPTLINIAVDFSLPYMYVEEDETVGG